MVIVPPLTQAKELFTGGGWNMGTIQKQRIALKIISYSICRNIEQDFIHLCHKRGFCLSFTNMTFLVDCKMAYSVNRNRILHYTEITQLFAGVFEGLRSESLCKQTQIFDSVHDQSHMHTMTRALAPSKQSTSADVSLTSVQRQFNVELTLD